jgi:Icc protein
MEVALIADPHLSLLDLPHSNIRLIDTSHVVAAIVSELQRRGPELAIWMGDLTHEGTPAVRAKFAQLVKPLALPCLWMWGNHDVELLSKCAFSDALLPCVRQMWLRLAGWEVVILDTVPELTPRNPMGQWRESDLALLRAVAGSTQGPLLVLAHHPPREKYLDMTPFWSAVSGFSGQGVFIGGHSHRDLESTQGNWRLIDVSSCCRVPVGYHALTLEPGRLSLDFVPVKATLSGPAPTDWQPDAPIFPLTVTCAAAAL